MSNDKLHLRMMVDLAHKNFKGPITKLPPGQCNLNNQHKPKIHLGLSKQWIIQKSKGKVIPTLKGNNWDKEQEIIRICSQLGIEPVYLHEVRDFRAKHPEL